ncbi:MAG TPA: choice-of-anchor D domain-containing protein [Gaiellaceae bacterium]|nr:choice-of-anchor D domain-containing protein [Gaiellaceae bacterium]
MRRLIGGGGLVVVALFVGRLLFTGGAGAQTPLPFSISPGAGGFPATQIGATTLKTFTFTWTSTQSGDLSKFAVQPPFLIQANHCGAMTYQQTCTVTAGFAPTQAGSASRNLTFAYTVGTTQGTDAITLSGKGVSTQTLPFAVSPGSGDFPDTRVGTTSSITFTFGWISLPGGLSHLTVPAPFSIQKNTCGAISFPNSCSVTVGFTPTELGQATGDLTFTYTAGSQQGTDKIRLTGPSTRCECTRLRARMIGWSVNHGTKVFLALRWKLACTPGHALSCTGRVQWPRSVKRKLASRGLDLVYPRRSAGFRPAGHSPSVGITCGATHRQGCSKDLISGVARFQLLGPARLRRGLTITWRFDLVCFSHPKTEKKRTLKVKFDSRGKLDRHASRLGPIVS